MQYAYGLKGRYHLGDIVVDGKIVSKWKLQEEAMMFGIGFDWLRVGFIGGPFETR
jgi:hypothetical protein